MRRLGALLVLAVPLSGALGACTHRITPPPSTAILEARAAAADRVKHARDAAVCDDPRRIQEADATVIRFRFLTAEIDQVGERTVARASAFARCDAATPIVIVAESDGRSPEAQQQALIAERQVAMRRALAAAGIPESRMTTAPNSAAAPSGALVLTGRNLGGV
jgi:outer membrane protein OmpA-like peptidoglycan-associated protein